MVYLARTRIEEDNSWIFVIGPARRRPPGALLCHPRLVGLRSPPFHLSPSYHSFQFSPHPRPRHGSLPTREKAHS